MGFRWVFLKVSIRWKNRVGFMGRVSVFTNVVYELVCSNCAALYLTGSTPLGMYRKLIEFHNKGDLSFKYVKTFNMDEYVGKWKIVPHQNLQSYCFFKLKIITQPSGELLLFHIQGCHATIRKAIILSCLQISWSISILTQKMFTSWMAMRKI